MDEKEKEQGLQPGRRLEEKDKKGLSPKGKVAVVCVAAVVGLLAAGYLGLCALASGDKALPGTYMGGVDLGGMTAAQAETALAKVATDRYEALEVPIQVGDKTVNFSAKQAGVHVLGGGEEAVRAGKGSFLAGGWNYLTGLLGRKNELSFAVSVDNADYVNDVFYQVAQAVDQPVEQPHWELEEDEQTARLILYKGKTGQSVDQEALCQDLMDALGRGDAAPIQTQVTTTAPQELDLDALVREIDRQAVDATLDVAADEVIPHKLGLKVDPAKAKELLDSLAEGESKPLELEVQEPEITTLELRATLFKDVLAEATSKVSGTANRVGNVKLAAEACNGTVLLPGEKFSYNQTTGQRTYAKGYRSATGFGMNGAEDMIGGGVCQPSSTLYLACLRANLEIVARTNHRYTVTYMPEGMDAQVSWPNMDFSFANNTPYPIKIEMLVENRECIARIYGTKTDDTYVEMESVRLGTTPFQTIYKPDETVPQGTTKVLVAPYTGRSVEAYKNLYAGDGTLISRTLVSKDYYNKCDKVIGYNPLDGAPDGSVPPITDPNAQPSVDPGTGLPTDPNTQPGVDPSTGLPVEPTGQPPVTEFPAASQPGESQTPAEPTEPAQPIQSEVPAEPVPVEPQPTPEPQPVVPEGVVVE